MADHVHPMPGLQLAHCAKLDEEYKDFASLAVPTDDIEAANVVTSKVAGKPGWHRPALDIDLPAKVIPSTTEGHYHLLIDHDVRWEDLLALLDLLCRLGIVQQGFVNGARQRGHTTLRLPWVKKPGVVLLPPTPDQDAVTKAYIDAGAGARRPF